TALARLRDMGSARRRRRSRVRLARLTVKLSVISLSLTQRLNRPIGLADFVLSRPLRGKQFLNPAVLLFGHFLQTGRLHGVQVTFRPLVSIGQPALSSAPPVFLILNQLIKSSHRVISNLDDGM